jgi:hypothetical protein
MTTPASGGAAQWWYERIEQHYKAMLSRLAEDEAILIEAILADGSRLTVTSLRYHGPDMAIVDGQDAGGRTAMLCAQIESVQILFTIVKGSQPGQKSKVSALA